MGQTHNRKRTRSRPRSRGSNSSGTTFPIPYPPPSYPTVSRSESIGSSSHPLINAIPTRAHTSQQFRHPSNATAYSTTRYDLAGATTPHYATNLPSTHVATNANYANNIPTIPKRLESLATKRQRIRIFGGEDVESPAANNDDDDRIVNRKECLEDGDEDESLCAPMIQVLLDLFDGVDYVDP